MQEQILIGQNKNVFNKGFYVVQEIMKYVSARLGSGLTTSLLNLIFSLGEKKVAASSC